MLTYTMHKTFLFRSRWLFSSCSSLLPCYCPSCYDGDSFVLSTLLFLISGILFILVSHILNHHPFSFSCLFALSLSAECLIPELGSSQQITALISLIINQYVTGSLQRLLANTGIWSAVRGELKRLDKRVDKE